MNFCVVCLCLVPISGLSTGTGAVMIGYCIKE